MTPQERDVIAGIFDRLKQAANQPRDPEAERFIAERLRDQPYAPYAMAQSVYVQEQAVLNLQSQVEDLQSQMRELQNRPAEAAAPAAGGFLSGIFGGASKPADAALRPGSVPAFPQRAQGQPSSAWNTQQPGSGMQAASMQQGMAPQGMAPQGMAPQGMAPQQQPSPWANQPAQPQARGGGFMASALTTAAGVAGGMMLGNVLTNAFSGPKAGADHAKAAETGSASETAKADSTGADTNGAGAQTAADNAGYDDGSSNAANYQNAGYEPPVDPGYDDGSSFDSGAGDDDSWA